jgi:hypothetical protein
LRPGETEWAFADRSIATSGREGELCVAYNGGRILVTARSSLWRVITPGGDTGSDVLVPTPGGHAGCSALYSYVLESHGELLWASVQVRRVRTISVVVHSLEGAATPENVRWIKKDGRSLADRVLFLGSPNSFAVDASLLRGHGGCAYFVHHNNEGTSRPLEQFGVFRYNFADGKNEFIERLPSEWEVKWDTENFTWLLHQPTIAPLQAHSPRNISNPFVFC